MLSGDGDDTVASVPITVYLCVSLENSHNCKGMHSYIGIIENCQISQVHSSVSCDLPLILGCAAILDFLSLPCRLLLDVLLSVPIDFDSDVVLEIVGEGDRLSSSVAFARN